MKELPDGFMPPIPAAAIPVGLKAGALVGLNTLPVGFGVNVLLAVGLKLGALVFGLNSVTLALIWGCPASGFLGMPLHQKVNRSRCEFEWRKWTTTEKPVKCRV